MTEAEWLVSDDVTTMLTFLEGKVDARKLRLFGVACCNRVWHLMTDARSRKAVKVAVRFAEGEANERERLQAYLGARAAEESCGRGGPPEVHREPAVQAAIAARQVVGLFRSASDLAGIADACVRSRRTPHLRRSLGRRPLEPGDWLAALHERLAQAALLRDIVGPLRPPLFQDYWRTPTVLAIARSAYDARDFEALPILADALLDAGCECAVLLDHCRQGGEHVRGCWVLDLVLAISALT